MKTRKTALIIGVSGQVGAYLAHFLLGKNYDVFGTSRNAKSSSFANLAYLGVLEKVHLHSADVSNFHSISQIIGLVKPDEIYNLSGQSSVASSFENPADTMVGIVQGAVHILEAVRLSGRRARLYNACSSECFGDTGERPANEGTPFAPVSPYAVAKAAAFWEVANYREAYGMFVCSGISYNHESPLRPPRFASRKIIQGAARIASGNREKLKLGNIKTRRDWGWAPEYVEAMWLMLRQDKPEDFVVATGEAHSLEEFAAAAFQYHGLDWQDHVEIDAALYRPVDIDCAFGDSAKAKRLLGWQAKIKMLDVVRLMSEAERLT